MGFLHFKLAFKKENNPEIEELIKLISKLPGLGPKSARRIILKLINNKEDLHKPMVNSMANVFKNIIRCNKCGSIKSINAVCQNCDCLLYTSPSPRDS